MELKVFANKVAQITFIKKIFQPTYQKFKNHRKAKVRCKMRQFGLEVLKDFDECLSSNNYEYSLAYGSMLGAVREKGFIKHDLDIDVYMWAEDYSENLEVLLKQNGFKLVHRFLVEDGTLGREETYCKNGVDIDIFYLYPAIDMYPYACAFSPLAGTVTWKQSQEKYGRVEVTRWQAPVTREYVRMKFETLTLNVSNNWDEILKYTYGDDYLIPDVNNHGINSNSVLWEGVKATFNDR